MKKQLEVDVAGDLHLLAGQFSSTTRLKEIYQAVFQRVK